MSEPQVKLIENLLDLVYLTVACGIALTIVAIVVEGILWMCGWRPR